MRALRRENEALKAQLAYEVGRSGDLAEKYARLRNRRVVKLGLAFSKRLGWVVGRLGRHRPVEAVADREAEVVAGLRLGVADGPISGPLVSLVVLTRNGRTHLDRLFKGLDTTTAYRSFEVVVVDNASTDDTDELLAAEWGFPLKVIRNDANTSFSAGCNQGAMEAAGDYLLFLNNDIEPINPGWMGAMVTTLVDRPDLGAVGAVLVFPAESSGTPLTIQHRGIGFNRPNGVPRPFNLGGEDPLSMDLADNWPAPGVTAACLLVSCQVFHQVEGFDERYVYGLEDVDFCLRLREAGFDLAVVGEARLFHYESATIGASATSVVRASRLSNQHHFGERWAAAVSRLLVGDPFIGEPFWSGLGDLKVAITLTRDDANAGYGDWYTAHELGDAFTSRGWQVVYAEEYNVGWYELDDEIAMVIGLLDRYDARLAPASAVKVAWVRNWTDRWLQQPWIDAYDFVIPSSEASRRVLLEGGVTPLEVMPLATNPDRFRPGARVPAYVCDYAFTGNSWGVGRSIVDHLDVRPGERFSIYGKNWERVGRVSRYWRGHLDYEELPGLYSSTKVVIDDTAGHTLPFGAINSRVFDALACGALVISNNQLGSDELFDGLLPTYRDRASLRAQLDLYLGDEILRRSVTDRLREAVLSHHTYELRAAQMLERLAAASAVPRLAIKIGPPDHDQAERWGDTHFARAFALAVRRRGWRTRIDILPEWDALDRQSVDVVLHLRGLVPYVPKRGHFNVLWIISHPEDVTPDECNRFDMVMVASEMFAAELETKVNVPVATLLQATDPLRFHPLARDPELATEVLFVGNSRGQNRPLVTAAIEAGVGLTIYGSGWEGRVPPGVVKGEYFPNDRLAELYSSAQVVLNDHWPDMARHGFISNRIFDALACGARVVSDPVPGLDNLLRGAWGTALLSVADPSALEAALKRPAAVEPHPFHQHVAEFHSFEARADRFIELIGWRSAGPGLLKPSRLGEGRRPSVPG